MSPLDKIRARLAGYPQATFTETGSRLTVHAAGPEGFDVVFDTGTKRFVVRLGGWTESFGKVEEALACFAFGLSAECRLKVWSRGGYDYRWTVQGLKNGRWVDDATTGFVLCPFWKKREERFLQNHLWERLPGAAPTVCENAK